MLQRTLSVWSWLPIFLSLAAFPTLVVAWIQEPLHYAALGDSYAAGDGAGPKLLWPSDSACGRFSKAYAYQILNSTDPAFASHWPAFVNNACGGATTHSLLWEQLHLTEHKDLITIQIGGNEADFFLVLNECIQQWHPLSTCDRELTRARNLIESTALLERFDDMLGFVKRRVADGAMVLVLGYPKFFNDKTDQCNSATFSYTNPANVLSNKLRREFNALVVMLNDVIRASAEAHGASYVDIDTAFEGHRFCERGVTEPRADNEDTWFFRETPSQGVATVEELQRGRYDRQSLLVTNSLKKFADLTRTFHPTVNGHAAIAKKIIEAVRVQMQELELLNGPTVHGG